MSPITYLFLKTRLQIYQFWDLALYSIQIQILIHTKPRLNLPPHTHLQKLCTNLVRGTPPNMLLYTTQTMHLRKVTKEAFCLASLPQNGPSGYRTTGQLPQRLSDHWSVVLLICWCAGHGVRFTQGRASLMVL